VTLDFTQEGQCWFDLKDSPSGKSGFNSPYKWDYEVGNKNTVSGTHSLKCMDFQATNVSYLDHSESSRKCEAVDNCIDSLTNSVDDVYSDDCYHGCHWGNN
jgi:aminopeptidase-like protein